MKNIKIHQVSHAKAVVILAHGAGADMDHDYILNLTQLLNDQQITVVRFNFPYMEQRKLDGKRRPPNKMPDLIAAYQQILNQVAVQVDLPIFIGGKSMGGRVAAMLANDKTLMKRMNVKGVICIGYPFHPIKKPEKTRLAPIKNLQRPMIILQGERDALGSQEEISHYNIPSNCIVYFFHDGDHDLKPRVRSGSSLEQHLDRAMTNISAFIDEYK